MKDKLIHIVSLKQGTFALQQMITFMDTHDEYVLIAEKMAEHFYEVSTNPNGNHFLRKLIPIIPFLYTGIIIKKIFNNFVELVNNKNSVCVLKVILHSIAKEKPVQ